MISAEPAKLDCLKVEFIKCRSNLIKEALKKAHVNIIYKTNRDSVLSVFIMHKNLAIATFGTLSSNAIAGVAIQPKCFAVKQVLHDRLAAVGAKTAYIMPGSPWEDGDC